MSRSTLHAAAVLAALLALAARPATAEYPGVLAADRHQILAEIAEGDEDAYAVELAGGSLLSVTVKAGKGAERPMPTLRLFGPTGGIVDPGDYLKEKGKKAVLKKFAVGESGVWKLVVASRFGTKGPYWISFRVKAPKRLRERKVEIAAGGAGSFLFTAVDGARARIDVRERSGPPLAALRLLGPDGKEVASFPGMLVRKKTKLRAKDVPLDRGLGTYRLTATGDAGGATVVDVSVAVAFPDSEKRKSILPPETILQEVRPPPVVRQEDQGVTLELPGGNFLEGTTAVLDGSGIEVTAEERVDAETLRLNLDIAPDAPYGTRGLTVYPPALLGEPQSIEEALVVNAPVPTLASASGGPVRQGDSGVVLEVTGTGFREGGRLSVDGDDIVVGPTTIVDARHARATLDVDLHSRAGPRDVIYRQPEDGGGTTTIGTGLFTVIYPDPTLTSISGGWFPRGTTGAVVTLTGSNFRDEGSVSSDDDVTITDATVLGETEVEVTLTISPFAKLGPHPIVYTQAAEGGGASATLTHAVEVYSEVKLTATDPDREEQFGRSLGISGDTVVVGAPTRDAAWTDAGEAFVFERDEGPWKLETSFHGDDQTLDLGFGVDVDGDTIAVGAPYDDTLSDNAGAVHVYERTESGWEETAKLLPGGSSALAPWLGGSVALDGDTLAAGARNHSPNSGTLADIGAVHVFVREAGGWDEEAILTAGDAARDDWLGGAIDLDGDTLVAGVPRKDVESESGAGAAYVFSRSGGVWSQEKLTAESPVASEQFGQSVAVDGDTVAIGVPGRTVGGVRYTGAICVFARSGETWTKTAELTGGDGVANQYLGYDLALHGDLLVAGCVLDLDGGEGLGSSLVFQREAGTWSLRGRLKGRKPACRGGALAIGAPEDGHAGTRSGSVFVYELE